MSHDGHDAEDEILVKRFTGGDRSAFDEIVSRHQVCVAQLVHRLLGWPNDVDDVVQNVFTSAYTGLKRFRGRSTLATWLTRIAINACRTHRRRQLLRLSALQDARARENGRSRRSAEDRAEADETLDRVRRAVRALPNRYREVIVLRYMEDLAPGEISNLLGISRNTVAVRLTRARARLKRKLAGLI